MAEAPTANPTDGDFEAVLAQVSESQWRTLWARMAAVDAESEHAEWKGGDPVDTIVVDGVEKPVLQMPYVEYSEAVLQLVGCIGSLGLVVPFDWSHWYRPDRHPNGRGLDAAPAADAVRLLTTIVRADRFNEGMIASALADGSLRAAVRRLRSWCEDERRTD